MFTIWSPRHNRRLWKRTPVYVLTTAFLAIGLAKKLFIFFCKTKDTFFIFTNNFMDLDVLSMSAISCYWLLLCRGQGCC